MAYLASDPNMQQQDPNQKDKEPSDSNPGVNVSGSAAPSAEGAPSAGGSAAKPSATPKATSSGRFQNLQSYLKANAGYNQGQGLAGQVGTTLAGQEANQEQAIGQESQRVQGAAQQASAQYDPSKTQAYLQQAFQDPTKIASDPNALAKWQQYYSGAYNPGEGYDASGNLSQAQQKFQQQTALVKNEPGRMQLLQQLYGTPGYSTGQQSLDNLLLQSQPGQLSQLQTQSGALGSQLGSAYGLGQTAAQQAVDSGQALAQQASAATQAGLSTNIDTEQKALAKKASDTLAQRQNAYGTALDQLRSGQFTPEVLSQLGLGDLSQQTYGVDPTKYLQDQVGNVGIGNVATAADQAKFQALAQLSGQPADSALGQFAKVGSSLGSAAGFDLSGFQQAANAAKGSLENEYGGLKTMLTNAVQSPSGSGYVSGAKGQGYATPSNYMVGSAYGTGSIAGDIAALQADNAQRQKSGGGTDNPYIQKNNEALAKLQALVDKYSINKTLGSGTAKSELVGRPKVGGR